MTLRRLLPLILPLAAAAALSGCDKWKAQGARALGRAREAVTFASRETDPSEKALEIASHQARVALQFDPNNVEAHQILAETGFIAFQSRNFRILRRVTGQLAKSVKQDPTRIFAHIALGELAMKMGDYALLKEVRKGLEDVPVEKLSAAQRLQRNHALFKYIGAPFEFLQQAASEPNLPADTVFKVIGEITGGYDKMRKLWDEAEVLRLDIEKQGVAIPKNVLATHADQKQQLGEVGDALGLMLRADQLWNEDKSWRQAYVDYYEALRQNDRDQALQLLGRATQAQPAFTEALYVIADQLYRRAKSAETQGRPDEASNLLDRSNGVALAALGSARANGTFLPMEDPRVALAQIHLLLGKIGMENVRALMDTSDFKRMGRRRRAALAQRIENHLREALRYGGETAGAQLELSAFTRELRPYLYR